MKSSADSLKKRHISVQVFKGYLRYIAEKHPTVDTNDLLLHCGLPRSYIEKNSNWVSITYSKLFTDRAIYLTGDADLPFKAGQHSIHADVIDVAILQFFMQFLNVHTIFKLLKRSFVFFNKIYVLEVLSSHKDHNSVVVKLVPNISGLSTPEIETFKAHIDAIEMNTKGWFSCVPKIFGIHKEASIKLSRSTEFLKTNNFELYTCTFFVTHPNRVENKNLFFSLIFLVCLTFLVVASKYYISENFSLKLMILITIGACAFIAKKSSEKIKKNEINARSLLEERDAQYALIFKSQKSLNERLLQLQVLNAINEHCIKEQNLEDLFQTTSKNIVEILNYDRIAIYIADDKQELLICRSYCGIDSELQSLLKKTNWSTNIDSDNPYKIANVYKHKKPFLIQNVEEIKDHFTKEAVEILKKSSSKSFLAVPICSETKSYGVIFADCFGSDKTLDQNDLNIISNIGHQLALVIENDIHKKRILSYYEASQKFIPFKTLKFLGYDSILDIKLGDYVEKEFTVLFSDIRGFTTLCESMKSNHPEDVIKFLNSYWNAMATVIVEHNGSIDKISGDGIIAIFESPRDAVNASINMIKKLRAYNQEHRNSRSRPNLKAGIGLRTGSMILGPIGIKEHMGLTVVSDVVNGGARLEGATKSFQCDIIVDSETLEKCGIKERILHRKLGSHLVKGKDEKILMYEIFESDEPQLKERKTKTLKSFSLAIALQEEGKISEATENFKQNLKFGEDSVQSAMIRMLQQTPLT